MRRAKLYTTQELQEIAIEVIEELKKRGKL